MQLRVLTWNIHKGFSALNRAFVLDELRAAMRASKADAVFLQEVQGAHAGHAKRVASWPTQPQFEFLADSVWSNFAYARNAVYPRGHHGNAILSRFPILSHAHDNISTNVLEQRGLLHCVVDVVPAARSLHLMCVHLNLTQRSREAQLDCISRRIDRHVPAGGPLILAGDFNDWRGRASVVLLERHGLMDAHEQIHGVRARTYPAFMPLLEVDRIYQRGLHLKAAAAIDLRPAATLSDHVALTATFRLPAAP